MKQRIITGLCIIAVAVPPLLLGGLYLRILIMALSAISVYEIIGIVDNKTPWYGYVALFMIVSILSLCSSERFIIYLSLLIVGLFASDILSDTFDITKISYLYIMSLLFATSVRGIYFISAQGPMMLFYVVVVTYVCDTGAYFIGSTMGKHKLKPRISPNKTIEGSIGGFICSFIVSMIFGYYILNFDWFTLIVSSILLPLSGQIGDLAFSSIKRHFGKKDFGTIFPGHGGALDRLDSLLFNLLVFSAILQWVMQ